MIKTGTLTIDAENEYEARMIAEMTNESKWDWDRIEIDEE